MLQVRIQLTSELKSGILSAALYPYSFQTERGQNEVLKRVEIQFLPFYFTLFFCHTYPQKI
jgi:hypothetical protein